MKQIYLDYAAAAPMEDVVITAMRPYFTEEFFNPSALYSGAMRVKQQINDTRSQVAAVLGARSSEIIFTAGATEANNLAIDGIMARYPDSNLVVSAVEHESVLQPAKNHESHQLPVDTEGQIDTEKLQSIIDDKTVLISVMYANNEVGTIQPLKKVAEIVRNVREDRLKKGNNYPLYFHSDAAQATNYLDLHVSRLGVDLLSLNGGKIYGPKQSGLLWIKSGIEVEPIIRGGGQERALRGGTENIPAIIGFGTALQFVSGDKEAEAMRLRKLQKLFIDSITAQNPNIIVNGSLKRRLPNNVHLTFPGIDNERLIYQLDRRGIMAAAGSACSASSQEPSHVLKAMGITDEGAQASLRFTMGRQTTEADIRKTVKTLVELLA